MKYRYSAADANTFHKYGVDITSYDLSLEGCNVVFESTETGHFEEFYSDLSTYIWFIIEGKGTYVIDDEHIDVSAKDIVVAPPKHRIHYFGKMKMLLVTTPPFNEQHEHHVRDVPLEESPYAKDAKRKTL
jgi:quercetin dioxygenase-like cupin family protein